MIFLILSASLAVLERKHAIDLRVQSNWGYASNYEQICLYLFKYDPNYVKEFLLCTSEDFEKTRNLDYLLEIAKMILPRTKYSLLEANINLSSSVPLVEFERKSSAINYIEGNPKEVTKLNLSNKDSLDNVVKLLKLNKDINITLELNEPPKNYRKNLRGYGFEMRPFKYSMEYDVKDSSEKQGEQSIINIDDNTFEYLVDFPQTKINLSAIDVNLKLLSYLAENTDKPAFKVLRDITNNWPAFSEMILNTDMNKEIDQMMSIMKNILSPYLTTTTINGRVVSIDNLDIFTVLEILQQETAFREVLSDNFNLTKEEIDKISTKPSTQQATYLDYRSDTIDYVNDIRRDSHYQKLPDNMEALGEADQLPFARRNLLNLVLFIDPSTIDGFTRYMAAFQLVSRGFPVRLGIAPVFDFRNRLSRRVAFAYSHMAVRDPKLAANFLSIIPQFTQLHPTTGRPLKFDEEVFATAYNALAASRRLDDWASLHSHMDPESAEYRRLRESQQRIRRLGVKRNTCAINGRIEEAPELSSQYLYLLKTESNEVRRVVNSLGELPEDVIDSYKLVNTVADTLRSPLTETGPIEGIGLISMSAKDQMEVISKIDGLDYFAVDKDASVSYILYTAGQRDCPAFREFAAAEHSTPSRFALNPERVVPVKESDLPLLVAGGRVFRRVRVTQEGLKLIDSWISCSVASHIFSAAPCHPKPALCAYLASIIVDWQAAGIERAEPNVDVAALGEPLVFSAGDADIAWEIIASPSSMEFQRIIDTAKYIADHNLMRVTLILNANTPLDPQRNVFECFYRKVLDSDNAVFSAFDPATTYSALPDVPQSWIIESLKADLDIDNIVVGERAPGVYNASYALYSLAVEGTAFRTFYDPAKGADLRLGNSRAMVMKAEGYFQLRAQPGRHFIELSPGRTSAVLEPIRSVADVDSFASRTRRLSLRAKAGLESASLFPDPPKPAANESRVDVFSVASGALYERLTKIMMLSVRRNSQRSVKFWLLRNFLSPSFKASLEDMARENGFEYEFVDYKWPQWLRPQSEKNRIIWANKILFLDEIFPMDLRRVIYIDADQIVRSELGELMDMDFHGAPYAFTPFCTENARNETRPFRFWEDGYWKSYLHGLPYHISALFAVDLARFRQMGAGDVLRMYYNSLSSTPGSLENLDQDLPNFVQPDIPIFSLPQEWLWCETWCSDESLPRAKTVDLCNNPLTHAGKLDVARQMVEEWPGLDEEARAIRPSREYVPGGWN